MRCHGRLLFGILTCASLVLLITRQQRSSQTTNIRVDGNLFSSPLLHNSTLLRDVFIGVKTSRKFHATRLKLLMETWIPAASQSVYVITDGDDAVPSGNLINSKCPTSHSKAGLCCKYEAMVEVFLSLPEKRWFCHMDDDTYLLTENLLQLLSTMSTNKDWYVGRPSLSHPLSISYRDPTERFIRTVSFWFATGGAGVCMTRRLIERLATNGHLVKGGFMRHCQETALPDDCTLGFIMSEIGGVKLTVDHRFHSHLERLEYISPNSLQDQITLSYSLSQTLDNRIRLPQNLKSDPRDQTNLYTFHCWLNPGASKCKTS